MRHQISLKVGPVTFRVGAQWRRPIDELASLYKGYPEPDGIADFTVRLEADTPWRRYLRPSVAIRGDYILPDAAPLSLKHGLLAAEMGMNLQMALGQKHFLLLHAASAEKDGRAVLMTGLSGAGKSTLSAILGERGWRFMGDEFALLDLDSGLLHPFPRPISLKNRAIDVMEEEVERRRFGPWLVATPKGTIRHLRPPADAIARMDEPARPVLILFPRFGREFEAEVRPVGAAEAFVRLTQASTNYIALGERGFTALAELVQLPARAIDYATTDEGVRLVESLWTELAS
jgi:HprK-related kinase A